MSTEIQRSIADLPPPVFACVKCQNATATKPGCLCYGCYTRDHATPMKPLNDYPTPETDAVCNQVPVGRLPAVWNYDKAINHARDLERRLALCRDALNELHYDCTASDFSEHWHSYKNAEEALTATAPQ